MNRLSMTKRALQLRGAVLPLVAVSLIPILGMVAVTLDLGLLLTQRRIAQTTADSAAMAASDQLFQSYMQNKGMDTDGKAQQAALAVAAANGYSNDGTQSTVTVNIPPQSGYFVGQPSYAEVIVKYLQPRSFARIWSAGSDTISARSVAQGQWAGKQIGILVLDPTGSQALSGGGGGTLTTTAKVLVNSNSVAAAATGGGSILTAPEFDITGGYSGSGFNGTLKTGVTPTPDPLAYLPPPDPATMPIQSNNKLTISNGTQTLQPGVYKGGISVSGQGGIVMQPGIYYMQGGGFSFTGQGSLLAPGVMIYNAPKNSNDIVSIQGSGKGAVNVTPPSSGLYQGLSIFQDRNAATSMDISGNGNFSFLGTFYAAKALLKISGNSPDNYIGSQYITYDLSVSGTGGVQIVWDANLVARFRNIGLVE
jgi:Putative Flp pilus-assembly TadE/G-like